MKVAPYQARKVLNPYDPREAIAPKKAAGVAGVTQETVINWCMVHGIGRKIGGRWYVSHPALLMMLESDHAALASYHDGERNTSNVRAYFERAGLADLAA